MEPADSLFIKITENQNLNDSHGLQKMWIKGVVKAATKQGKAKIYLFQFLNVNKHFSRVRNVKDNF